MQNTNHGLFLVQLNLKNFATFDDQSIQFDDHFNVIIGETGSGKSLILDALQLILGQRADKKLIRKDCDFAMIEAHFECQDPEIKSYFYEAGYPFEDQIVIKRIIDKNGKSKSFINHQSCPLGQLTSFAKRFIDLVGQFENQKLLSPEYQLQLLDSFAFNMTLLSEYQDIFTKLSQAVNKYEELNQAQQESIQRLDFVNFQIKELEVLDPSVDKEEELLTKKRLYQNHEENLETVRELNYYFDGADNTPGILTALNRIEKLISDKILDTNEIEQFYNASEVLKDINYKINSSVDIEFDEADFEKILSELDLYQKLKRKFRTDTSQLAEIYHGLVKEREEIHNLDHSLNEVKNLIKELQASALQIAEKLHQRRVESAKELSDVLTEEIQALRMNGAQIDIQLSKIDELNKYGLSNIDFMAETNPGEGFYRIKDIASGGELSRILLALRTVLSSKDSISIFLFDEIDTGIGGETAKSVGQALTKVANSSQVIAITHLPQIANFAQKLIEVSKDQISAEGLNRTISVVSELSGNLIKDKVKEMSSLEQSL